MFCFFAELVLTLCLSGYQKNNGGSWQVPRFIFLQTQCKYIRKGYMTVKSVNANSNYSHDM